MDTHTHTQIFARIFTGIKFDLIQLNVASSSKLQINTNKTHNFA